MSEALQAQVKATPATHQLTPAHPGMLQRKCACGSSASVSGQCHQCKDKEKPLQSYSNSRPVDSLLGSLADSSFPTPPLDSQTNSAYRLNHSFGRVKVHTRTLQKLQPKLSISSPTDQHEQEADRAAELITGASLHSAAAPSGLSPPLSSTQPLLQTSTADVTSAAEVSPPTSAVTSEPTSQTDAAEQTQPAGLIIDDDAAQLAPAQMRKTQFLDQLQSEVCAAADAELVRVGRSAQGCPYIENWIGYYRSRPSQYVERSLRKYAPEAAGATSARDYIPLVAQRVRRAVSVWATTGEITGVPDELAGQLPSGGLLGAAEGALSGIGGAISGAIGSVGAAIGSIFTKAKEGGPRQADDPQQIQSQLSSGQALDGGVRSKMETAFGHDFSRVRVHTGSRAAGLSNGLNARAFTIGRDVAFGAGEYQPGTLVGDALIAHELAHVVQQEGGSASAATPQMEGAEYNTLEADADRSAVSAMVSIWTGAKGTLAEVSDNAIPRLRSGLRLSSCKSESTSATPNACTTRTTPVTPLKTVTIRHSHLFGGGGTSDFTSHLSYANRAYAIAGITLAAGNVETIDETSTKAPGLLGSNALLNDSGTNPQISSYTTEETALMAHNSASGEIRAYYILGVENTADLLGRGFLQDNAVIILATAANRTLGHEAGHILIGAGHPSNNDNLMAQTSVATGVECLSDEQINTARNSSLAR